MFIRRAFITNGKRFATANNRIASSPSFLGGRYNVRLLSSMGTEVQPDIDNAGQARPRLSKYEYLKQNLDKRQTLNAIRALKMPSGRGKESAGQDQQLTLEQSRELIAIAYEQIQSNPRNIGMRLANSKIIIGIFNQLKRKNADDSFITRQMFDAVVSSLASLQESRQLHELFRSVMDRKEMTFDINDYKFIINHMVQAGDLKDTFAWFDKNSAAADDGSLVLEEAYLFLCERFIISSNRGNENDRENNALKIIDLTKLQSIAEKLDSNCQQPRFDRNRAVSNYENLILVFGMKGEFQSAIECLEKLVKLKNGHPGIYAYRNLITVAHKNQQSEILLNAFQEARRFFPDRLYVLKDNLICVLEELSMNPSENIDQDLNAISTGLDQLKFNSASGRAEFQNRFMPRVLKALEGLDQELESVKKLKYYAEHQLDYAEGHAAKAEQSNPRHLLNLLTTKLEQGKSNIQDLLADYESLVKVNEKSAQGSRIDLAAQRIFNDNVANYLKNHKSFEGMQKFLSLSSSSEKPQFMLCLKYLQMLLDSKRTGAAFTLYRKMVDQYNMTFPANIMLTLSQSFGQNIGYGQGKASILDSIMQDMEKIGDSDSRIGSKSVSMARNYNTMINSYGNDREFDKVAQTFKRMISATNPLQVAPTPGTFNGILMALMRDWNADGFNTLYEAMKSNETWFSTNGPVKTDQERRKIMLEHYSALAPGSTQVDGAAEYLSPPPYVIRSRQTENIRLTSFLTMANKSLNEIVEAFKSTVAEPMSENVRLGQPNETSFELMSGAYLRDAGCENWHDKSLQKKAAKECVKLFADTVIDHTNVDDALTSIKNVALKHIAAPTATEETVAAESQQNSDNVGTI